MAAMASSSRLRSAGARAARARLLGRAMGFCRERAFASVHLWTFAGLHAARKLYERNGFVLTEEVPGDGWGPAVTGQKFEPAR